MGKRKLIAQDGRVFLGEGFGSGKNVLMDVVCHRDMVGYQEIITDPAKCGKGVLFTYPILGSYGIIPEDAESDRIQIQGLICHEYNAMPSNFRQEKSLGDAMEEAGVPGIYGVDTRAIQKHIAKTNLSKFYLCDEDDEWVDASVETLEYPEVKSRHYENLERPKIVLVDLGATYSFIDKLRQLPFDLTIINKSEIQALQDYDCMLISDGPEGQEIEGLKNVHIPLIGIGLGAVLLAEVSGLDLEMHCLGHYGNNHGVMHVETGQVDFYSQSHRHFLTGSALEASGLEVLYRNTLDQSVEGFSLEHGRRLGLFFTPSQEVLEKHIKEVIHA